MAVKTTGAEFKRFYSDAAFWPDDDGKTYHDDTVFEVDGKEVHDDFDMSEVGDAATVKIVYGVVYSPLLGEGGSLAFEAYFKRWRKVQSTAVFVVECPVDRADGVRAAVQAAGGKVL